MAHAETKNDLQVLLAVLRAVRMVEHTAHWQASGPQAYSDHLLFGRLYEVVDDEIDGLGERMVMLCGAEAVEAAGGAEQLVKVVKAQKGSDPLEVALGLEEMLQKVLVDVRDCLRENGDLSLGMDNFLQSIGDTHDTSIYLLRQRLAK